MLGQDPLVNSRQREGGRGTLLMDGNAAFFVRRALRRVWSCRGGTALTLGAALSAAAATLAGCGSHSPEMGSFLVDPGRYSAYHCKDLVSEWKSLADREKVLRNLMAKASETSTGSVIGTMTYRGDYETVLAQQKVLQKTAAEKHCELVATFSSDQGIR
jgi:hypothetical protein